ncbi:MAG: hypothetical protein QM733_23665 [Ilumatobacteraceae bacterium]
MIQQRTTATPHIPTRTTGRLLDDLTALARREPSIAARVDRIRAGDDAALLQAAVEMQHGDQGAATIALGGLLPRLCAVVIDRHGTIDWKPTIDDYLTLAYLVLLDIDVHADSRHLCHKVLARTRRRHERQASSHRLVPTPDERILEIGPVVDDVEARALDRLRLLEVGAAVRSGCLTARLWQAVVTTSLAPRSGPASDRDRRAAARARRALNHLNDCDQAA